MPDPISESMDAGLDTFSFYLPQFYPIPLNSKWWGEGYTEWNAVVSAQRGSRSPSGTVVTPADLGFYDLRNTGVRRRQGELARSAGLSAFAIYHYWSKGNRLLPDVEDLILTDGEPDFPFFLCWANHDWTLAWQGRPDVVTYAQEYDENENDDHFQWFLEVFSDSRYYRLGSAPVLAVYDPDSIPHARKLFARWRMLARKGGYSGLVILGIAQRSQPSNRTEVGVDGWIQGAGSAITHLSKWKRASLSLLNVRHAWRFVRWSDFLVSASQLNLLLRKARRSTTEPMIPTVLPSWNNAGRRSRRAWYFKADPDAFRQSLLDAIADSPLIRSPDGARRLLAINAWNEWGENMVLEPSTEHGHSMLDAVASVLIEEGSGPHT